MRVDQARVTVPPRGIEAVEGAGIARRRPRAPPPEPPRPRLRGPRRGSAHQAGDGGPGERSPGRPGRLPRARAADERRDLGRPGDQETAASRARPARVRPSAARGLAPGAARGPSSGDASRSLQEAPGGQDPLLRRRVARRPGMVRDRRRRRPAAPARSARTRRAPRRPRPPRPGPSPRPPRAASARSRAGSSRPGRAELVDEEALRLDRGQPARRLADPVGDAPRQLEVVRGEVDVPGDEERACADARGAGARDGCAPARSPARGRGSPISVRRPSYWPRRRSASFTRSGRVAAAA